MNEENLQNNKKGFAGDLFKFLSEYSVIGLAIGVIIAQASKSVVDAIVAGFFTPLIKLIVPGSEFEKLIFTVKGVKFDVGSIIDSLLTFFIVLIILYVIIKKILKKEDLLRKQ
jgi:large-conductance mechanosensitive channel